MLLFVLRLILALGVVAPAPQPPGEARNERPAIVKVVDAGKESLGPIPVGEFARRSLTLRNVTDGPVDVEVIGKSCACLQVEKPADPVAPGKDFTVVFGTGVMLSALVEHHFIELAFSTRDSNGLVAARQREIFTISYTSDVQCGVFPTAVIRRATAGDPLEFEVRLLNPAKEAFRIDEVVTPWPWLKVESVLPHPSLPGRITVRFAGTPPAPGRLRGETKITLAGSASPIPVDTAVVIEEPMIATPSGVVTTLGASHAPETPVRLTPRAGAGDGVRTASIRLRSGATWVHVDLSGDEPATAVVRLDVSAMPRGRAALCETIEVLDDAGVVVCTIPVVVLDPARFARGQPAAPESR